MISRKIKHDKEYDLRSLARAHTCSVCVCASVSAHEGHHFARARVIFAIEGRAERVAEREGGGGGVVRHARETPPTSRRRKGRKFLLFLFFDSLSLTRFPFAPGFDRGSTKLLLPPAVVRSKSSASSPLSTFNRR